jgi:holo-[acyl-carrier protein] synthase
MILGLGTDLIDIRRIEKTLERFGERFIQRIFTDVEQAKAERRKGAGQAYAATYAKRYAAKEAASKALGTGFRQGVYWRDLGVVNLPTGQPTVKMTGGAAERLDALIPEGMEARVDLTITDEYPIAEAMVIISAVPRGIFHQNDNGTFSNTPQSDVLRKSVPGSIYPLVRQNWQDVVWNTYAKLPDGLQTGEPAFMLAHGKPFFDYLADVPEHGAMFDESMALMSGPENTTIAQAYPFGDAHTVMDIGGGRGGLLAAVLAEHQDLNGILFDQPQVIVQPDAIIEANLEDRCKGLAGNFFEAIPAMADIYMLKRILHDWNDEDAIRILTAVRQALKPENRVAVIDAVIKPGNDADPNKYLDVGIMTLLQGRERTVDEFEALFSAAGLQLLRIIPTPAPSTMSIIEGALA